MTRHAEAMPRPDDRDDGQQQRQQEPPPVNTFAELAAISAAPFIEKKGGLSYVSWANAVDQLLRRDPDASWSYGAEVRYGDTVMVSCTVRAFGRDRTMQLPVMDNRNRPIAGPDAFQTNTAMQRCLVKAIACHGLFLHVYAGEDVPRGTDPDELLEEPPDLDAATVLAFESAQTLDNLAELWRALPTKARHDYAAIKDAAKARLTGATNG